MSQFAQLVDEVADAKNYPLDGCLLKAKLLASRLRARKFRQWVDAELEGYPNAKSVPDYRVVGGLLLGHFSGMFGSGMRNVRLSVKDWGAEMREMVECHHFCDNVGSLEQMLAGEGESYYLRQGVEFISAYREAGNVQVDGMVLQDAQLVFNKAAVRGVLHAIRTRLLDFLIELRERYPELEKSDDAAAKVPAEEVARIAEQRIYHNCEFFEGDKKVGEQNIQAGRDINVGGDFVVADKVKESLNKVTGSKADAGVIELVGRLAEAVERMCDRLPQEKQREAAQELDNLAAEVAKEQPRKGYVRAACEELLSLAKTAGQTAVSGLVTALLQRIGA